MYVWEKWREIYQNAGGNTSDGGGKKGDSLLQYGSLLVFCSGIGKRHVANKQKIRLEICVILRLK